MAEKKKAGVAASSTRGQQAESKTSSPVNTSKFDYRNLNSLAVVSIATALTSIGAVAAIITGHVALTQIKASGQSGRGLAIAGTLIGYLTLAFWITSTIGFFIFGAYLKGRYGMDWPMHQGWMWGPER